MKVSGKFCPICKQKNLRTATICSYCGAILEEHPTVEVTTIKNAGELASVPAGDLRPFIDFALIPEGGIGIYVAGALKPQYLAIDHELLIGRMMEASSESVLGLSDVDAYNMGLSRRHAIIRRIESRYEITDLSSTNGTWLNNERLIPNKPYPFASGSQIQVGRLRLFVIYHHALDVTKKK